MLRLQGNKVHEMIVAKGYQSDTEFAKRNGFVQSTFAGWISGRRGIKREQLDRLARILFVPVCEICDSTSRKTIQMDEDIKRIRTIFEDMTDDQRTKVISVALALLDGADIGDDL